MPKKTKILDPACAKCKQPMTWHSAQVVNGTSVNVFRCKSCDKFTANADNTAVVAAPPLF